MFETEGPRIAISVPSAAIQEMCNLVAIAKTKSPNESLQELIVNTLLTFEEEKTSTANEVGYILKTMFGIEAQIHQVQEVLDHLVIEGRVHRPMEMIYVLTPDARIKAKARIDQASLLQDRVRMQWINEILRQFPTLNADLAWDALLDYLAKAFLRHGIQVASFLDPSANLPKEYAISLSALLAAAVQSNFDQTQQEFARRAISGFLANVGNNKERAQFISECADGAANYFSLSVSSKIAARFREKLKPFSVFCDTNFLFGILDLHVHPLVELSNELLEAIAEHSLPITVQYHTATLQELLISISHYGEILRRHKWPIALSRAATTSQYMSGIELKYHQKNAETGIDVDSFLSPYQHVDELLAARQINVYNPPADRLSQRAALEAEYREFLERLQKEKPHSLIAHDAAVLDCVRSLRNSAQSTLEAGALLVTCDYTLYRFDNEASRNKKTLAAVVLPNILWQILRPFIPASQDFERSFAETFAIPEFRTIGSNAAKACSKMLSLLSAYKDFPEETAARLLSNGMLIDALRASEDNEQFQAQVESAIIAENQALLEEHAALARQVETLRAGKEQAEKALEEQKYAITLEFAKTREAMQEKEKATEELSIFHKEAEAKLKEMEAAKSEADEARKVEEGLRRKKEAQAIYTAKFASIIIAILLSLIFILSINNIWHWDWLLNHPNGYSLQASICLAVSSGIIGLWVKPWRKALWGTLVAGAVFVILQLLGGPH